MTARGAKVLAIGLWAACLVMTSTAVVLAIANPARTSRAAGIAAGISVLVFPTVGALIAIRRPPNPIGWLYLTTGVAFGLGALTWEFEWWAVATGSDMIHFSALFLAVDGDLAFEVTDDGHGFDTASTGYGTGLRGMTDRLEAISGELTVSSAPGSGTTVSGRIPLGGWR